MFFPICDSMHYSLFAVNRREGRFESLDSKYPQDLQSKWKETANRIMQYAIVYFHTFVGPKELNDYAWFSMEGVYQPNGSNDCGVYLLNLVEVWEGTVEDYMVHQWKIAEYMRNRRDTICLDLVTSPCNDLFGEVRQKAIGRKLV
ncbi:hypothetical protein LINPERHAP2_LOCUS33212 [Linum perenne]